MRLFDSVVLDRLRASYQALVEEFAVQLRPRFASGELCGRLIDDWDLDNDNDPIDRLEKEALAVVPDFSTAYLVLACSPAEADDLEGGLHIEDAQSAAAECVIIDAFRLARARGWWVPRLGEYIGQAEWRALREGAGAPTG